MSNLFEESPILGALPIAVGVYYSDKVYVVVICIIILLFLIYFYRNPASRTGWADNIVVAPSYGTVCKIGYNPSYLGEEKTDERIHICIFLSPLDVHQQYYPMNGFVTNRVYDDTGTFALAYKLEKSDENEKKLHFINTKFGEVIVTQIAGVLPRRIVSDYGTGPCEAGQRLGMIKFGSRVDISLPSEGLELDIKEGDCLIGGEQIGHYGV